MLKSEDIDKESTLPENDGSDIEEGELTLSDDGDSDAESTEDSKSGTSIDLDTLSDILGDEIEAEEIGDEEEARIEHETSCIELDLDSDNENEKSVPMDEYDKLLDNKENTPQEYISQFSGDGIDVKKVNNVNLSQVLENLELTSPEPWPKDVKLFQPYEVEQILLPDNANCLAVQAFLKMCDLSFIVEPRANAEAMSPSGKVPFIKVGAFVISELEPIVQFVNNRGISLTEKLDPELKSDMRAYMSLVHTVLEVAELYICWCDKETYNEVTSMRHGSIYPWPLNIIQNRAKRNTVIKKLKVLNWYNKTLSEVFKEVENCCQALTDRLENKDYFFGDKPTELDALVFGHLFSILTTPLPNSHIANTVRNYPVLINLVQRIEKSYFNRETRH